MNYIKIFLILAIFSLPAWLSGCFSSTEEAVTHFQKPDQADTTMDKYIIQPPDVISVNSSKIPELQGEDYRGRQQIVRPDGKISFENIGEIPVAGKSPREVAKIIYERISELYVLPDDSSINVKLEQQQSKYYYILGQVDKPGAQPFTGRETTLSAVSKAGPNVRAWEQRIQVVRADPSGKQEPSIFELDFEKMVVHGDMSKNVLLQEGDIIYVPPTILAAVGLTVEEFVGPILRSLGGYRTITGDYN